jgi:7-cyano-7-deazaguanine synthase
MKAMQLALSLGMDRRFLIDTPLMWIDKADTWQLAESAGRRPAGGPDRGAHPHLLPG